jgi:acetoin utilization protein AcuB
MKVTDIMTWNVISVSSDTLIMEARKIIETHRVRRLPVIDKGKLVGLVTFDRIVGVGPSPASTLSMWEFNYILAKMTVKEIMQKDVVTVNGSDSIEQALTKGHNLRLGIMPVMEGDKVIGVVTTTDFAIKIINPVLGIGQPGTRLDIAECNQAQNICEIMQIAGQLGYEIVAACTMPPSDETPNGFMLHVDKENAADLVKAISEKHYKVIEVPR